MDSPSSSAESILAAARKVVAHRGPGQLTLSAVAAEAGVSRPTLYRWFPTKTALLTALSEHEERQFDEGLRAVIAAHRSPRRKLDATLRYIMTYLDEALPADPIGIDPAFCLESLARSLPPHVDILARLLDDGLAEVPAVRAGTLSKHGAAELFLRLAYSHYLVPHADPEALLASLSELAGLPRRCARRILAS